MCSDLIRLSQVDEIPTKFLHSAEKSFLLLTFLFFEFQVFFRRIFNRTVQHYNDIQLFQVTAVNIIVAPILTLSRLLLSATIFLAKNVILNVGDIQGVIQIYIFLGGHYDI